MVFGSGYQPPSSGMEHADPDAIRASKEKDHTYSMGLGDDILYIAGLVVRIVTWPLRVAFRIVRRS